VSVTAPPGLLIAAPASGSGKTVLTLALLRHLRARGLRVGSLKVGPDYIDPAFHAAASGRACLNLDPWAMRPATLAALAARAGAGADILIGEGVMGLFDGAPGGGGSTADLAALTGWPVILAVDARAMGASAAAIVRGFAAHRDDVNLAGVVFNRVAGAGHARLLRAACEPLGVPVLGCVPRVAALELPARHLGLVQAGEHDGLEPFLERAAAIVSQALDMDALLALARPCRLEPPCDEPAPMPALGRRIAVARDIAFAFAYPFVLDGWRGAGAQVLPFSPLADEAPDAAADAVYLPGGYPELYGARLAANRCFLDGLRAAAARGAAVYGECGGYMVLGQALTDRAGARHPMAGLLPVETSFAHPRLRLGYRAVEALADGPLGAAGARFRGHEFHYAATLSTEGPPLFRCRDGAGEALGQAGCWAGTVGGSFIHLIDARPPPR